MLNQAPLTRRHVTIASRVMLPAYPVFATFIGLSFTLTPDERLLATPSLRYANALVDIDAWGVGFLALAAWLFASLLAHSRPMYRAGLGLLTVWMGLWTLVIAASVLFDRASWSAWAWPAFIVAACWATLLSLTAQEA